MSSGHELGSLLLGAAWLGALGLAVCALLPLAATLEGFRERRRQMIWQHVIRRTFHPRYDELRSVGADLYAPFVERDGEVSPSASCAVRDEGH